MSWINPLRPTICPYCFRPFHLYECEVVDASGNTLDPKPQGLQQLVYRVWIPPLTGTRYTSAFAGRKCPHCGSVLPHTIEYMENQVIALVGPTFSGKSHFIAALIAELERTDVLRNVGGGKIKPLTQAVEKRYQREFYEPLFVQKEALLGNQPVQPGQRIQPLMYTMTFPDKARPNVSRNFNLVFFDAQGEDLVQQENIVSVSRFILNAAGIIFLIDPLTMPGIVENLPPHLVPEAESGVAGYQMLNRVVSLLRQEKGVPTDKLIPTPAAITLAKSDLLRYIPESEAIFPRTAAFLQRPSYSQGFRLSDFQEVNNEVRQIVEHYDGPSLLTASEAFENVGFFAVSATGAPEYQIGRFREVLPRRCPDPLLWILWKLGVIDAKP